jgi:eukaryotic-like serine/threonine-protein kinase
VSLDGLRASLADRYRIERELGAGGMATVYLAHDLKHDRKVAIKVLRPELAAVIGAERFLREIKTIANLQHPHILGLIDSGEVNGTAYYVMPYVEGESLRDRLTREKQLPVADAVRLATEVASALDYAHRHGVIHRDIKPENVMLHDGAALVTDFGIALAVSSAGGTRMTETGMSLGTPHYMSPEQAMGEREITARSDVYALGAMTYEMLVGEPPFTGPTAQAIIAKVMTTEPTSLAAQRKSVPPAVEDAVLTAIQKLPADRFATAAEFAVALTDVHATAFQTRVARGGVASPARRRGLVVAGITLAAGCLAAGWLLGRAMAPARGVVLPIVRYAMPLPDSAAVVDGGGSSINFSPDGSRFAYVGPAGLLIRDVDQLESRAVPGATRGTYPFFSPDGRWLGFAEGAKLRKVSLAGGAPVTICDSCIGYSFQWGADDTVRYHTAPPEDVGTRVLMAVAARGGRPYEVARPDSGSGEAYRQPVLLPGTRTLLFADFSGSASRLAALDLTSGRVTRFDQSGFTPQWTDAGFVTLSTADGALLAVPFDKRRARPTGPPVVIARDVSQPDAYSSRAAVSLSGGIVYIQGGGALPRDLLMVSRSGQVRTIAGDARLFANPRVSPDGRRIAIGIADRGTLAKDVWVLDLLQQTWSKMTTNGISERPIWTADGQRLIYSSNDNLWWIAADGSGRPDSLEVANGSRFGGSVTPDNRTLIYQESGSERSGIRRLAFDSAGASERILPGNFGEAAPALSPDGHWLAYQSTETGRSEVYVRRYPELGARISISLQGGGEPVWAHSGRELFYRSGDSLIAAAVATGATLTVTGRRTLFAGSYLTDPRFREYDVMPDDQHIIMLSGGKGVSTLIGLQNAFAHLGRDRQAPR